MPVVIRPARAEELQHAEELVARSINDLAERHGFGTMATLRAPHFQMFSLKDDPDGLWVAEVDGEIAGFAMSWACGNLWFLAELFVAPDQQGSGIGHELLARAFAHARKSGATNKSLITFAFNVVSQGLYVRHGMLPRLPLYLVAGDAAKLRPSGDALHSTGIQPTAHLIDTLARFDVNVLGISREKHHRYLASDPAMTGVLLHDGADCVGYAYVSAAGHVGPLAVARAQLMGPAFRAALDLAAAGGATQISAFLPGTSDALGIAIESGLRIKFPMVLVAEHEFGDWTRYLPRNPGFM